MNIAQHPPATDALLDDIEERMVEVEVEIKAWIAQSEPVIRAAIPKGYPWAELLHDAICAGDLYMIFSELETLVDEPEIHCVYREGADLLKRLTDLQSDWDFEYSRLVS